MKGRYIDWFEKRGGEWRIRNRVVIYDWVEQIPLPPGSEQERFGKRKPVGGRYPGDPVYTLFA